jgi:hypothetical protein
MLQPKTLELWQHYQNTEKDRIGYVSTPALEAFIVELLQEKEIIWHQWAIKTAFELSEGYSNLPIRLPLFRHIIAPALISGISRGVATCARTLANFEIYPYESTFDRSVATLLQKALHHDPQDQLARERLVSRWESDFEYALHEIPDGVLYKQTWANIVQCDQLLGQLKEFQFHVSILNKEQQFAELIDDCYWHFIHYREFLAQGYFGKSSYQDFLANLNITL